MKTFKHILISTLPFLVFTIILLVGADDAYAQIDSVSTKASEIKDVILKVLKVVFIASFALIGYLWVKGSPEARSRFEKALVGLAVAGAGTELVEFFL